MGFFFLHKIERQYTFQHSIFLTPKPQMAPLKIFCNSTKFMQDTATSPAARHHLGHWNTLIPGDLEIPNACRLLPSVFIGESFQEAWDSSRQAPEAKRQNDQKVCLHVYNWTTTSLHTSPPSTGTVQFRTVRAGTPGDRTNLTEVTMLWPAALAAANQYFCHHKNYLL